MVMISQSNDLAINAPMDTTSSHTLKHPVTISSDFASSERPRHDASQSPNPDPALPHPSTPPFCDKLDSSNDLSPALHVPLSCPPVVDMSNMDVLVAPSRAPGPGFIPDFPSQNPPFDSMGIDIENALSEHSDGAPPPSSDVSHDPSSSVHGLAPVYTISSSSLASALDTIGVPSMAVPPPDASPAVLTSSGSETGFTSTDSTNSTSSHDSSFMFPPTDVVDNFVHKKEPPDVPGGPHLMVVGDMLKNVIQTALSAQHACSKGQSTEAGIKINELKKAADLIQELMAATRLADSPPSPARTQNYSGCNSRESPPSFSGATQEQHSLDISQFAMVDIQNNLDMPDMPRKRCASAMAGDRVMKALKLEPQDDAPIPVSTPPTSHVTKPFTSSDPNISRPHTPMSHPTFNLLSQPPSTHVSLNFNPMPISSPNAQPTSIFDTPVLQAQSPIIAAPAFPTAPTSHGAWPERSAVFPGRQHQHTSSASSLNSLNGGLNLDNIGPMPATLSFPASGSFNPPPAPITDAVSASAPMGRVSRSGSVANASGNPFAFDFDPGPMEPFDFRQTSQSSASSGGQPYQDSSSDEDDYDIEYGSRKAPNSGQNVFGSRPTTGSAHHNVDNMSERNHGNDVPQEYRAEVDRIFFEFLNKTCSNLEATDAKGEPIHQTLMAKKMQRLDESPDFRPFKFRIQAFTNAFLEELARQGYPEEKIPMKKIRNYLWSQPYISRFNEDGKKAKSKGNHIWNIDAKKAAEGGWHFRPFQRKLAGAPPGVAYVGLRWSWTPRIWDPWGSRPTQPITYQSPSLPSWLSWKEDTLFGIPPADSENCDITAEAIYTQDGQEERLSHSFHLNIAPMSALDTSFPSSRRASVNGDIHNPRRVQSDSVVPQVGQSRSRAGTTTTTPTMPVATQDAQVMQVLTTAAQRVAQVAQSQVIASPPNEPVPGLQSLAKQQHVLTMTAQAFDQEVTGQRTDGSSQQSPSFLAAAAQQVVFQAARQVAADRSAAAAIGITTPPAQQVTVNEVSVATQSAVAQAVEITGPLSSEVDVLMTASSLLERQTRGRVNSTAGLDTTQLPPPQPARSLTTGSTPLRPFPSLAPVGHFPPSVLPQAGLPEYVQQ